MNRDEFVRFIAALSAGNNVKSQQLAAFERYYDLNSPKTKHRLVAVDDIWVGGIASVSLPLKIEFFCGFEPKLNFGINAFGGTMRWLAAPDQKIITLASWFHWRMENPLMQAVLNDSKQFQEHVTGHISYIDQDGLRNNLPIIKAHASLTGQWPHDV